MTVGLVFEFKSPRQKPGERRALPPGRSIGTGGCGAAHVRLRQPASHAFHREILKLVVFFRRAAPVMDIGFIPPLSIQIRHFFATVLFRCVFHPLVNQFADQLPGIFMYYASVRHSQNMDK